MIFIHTADWQLGKPFAGVADDAKRSLLQEARIEAIQRIGEEAARRHAEFVVVSGDLFDSFSPTKATVSAACRAIGRIGLPVFAIPGNHDHGDVGSVWHQAFFQREQHELAPNLRVLLSGDAVELESAVLFPCPLLRRHESGDPTACLRAIANLERYGSKARIVIAHGTTVDFSGPMEEDEEFGRAAVNVIDVSRLRDDDFDYIALGDWHGTKQITSKVWYSGTPEPDRFPKGSDHAQGNVLLVEVSRGSAPRVERIATTATMWCEAEYTFTDAKGPEELAVHVESLTGSATGKTLLRLRLQGALGVDESRALDDLLESWEARLICLKLQNDTVFAPSEAELQAITTRSEDPLVARVATRLANLIGAGGPDALTAQLALRELYLSSSAN